MPSCTMHVMYALTAHYEEIHFGRLIVYITLSLNLLYERTKPLDKSYIKNDSSKVFLH